MSTREEWLSWDSPRWRHALSRLPHDFYHLPSYSLLEARRLDGECRVFLFTDDGRQWLVPLIFRQIPGTSFQDAISAYGYPGPLIEPDGDVEFCHRATEAMMTGLKNQGCVSAFIRLHPLLSPAEPLSRWGELVHHGDTVVIDLQLTEEEMWRQVRRDHRNQINRAHRRGLSVSIDSDWGRFDDFLEVYRQSMTRVSAADSYFFAPDYFRGLRDALGEKMVLCTVEDGDRTMCAGLFSLVCGLVQFHLSGTHNDSLRDRPSKLMLDAVRRWAKDQGANYFHLGGGVGSQRDSLFEFKAGFSRTHVPFHTWRLILDRDIYENLCRAAGQAPGEAADNFFPLYRSPGV